MALAKRKKTKSVLKVGGKCASDTSQCLTCSLAVCACAVERETADTLRAHPVHGGSRALQNTSEPELRCS